MKRLILFAALAAGCATVDVAAKHEESYRSDTLLVNRLMGPMGIEPSHGQVTVAVQSKFTEKLLRASLQPNILTLAVDKPGRVWKQEVSKLAMSFDNGVWLRDGALSLAFNAEKLDLQGDLIGLRGSLDGHGTIGANLRFFGVNLQRDVEVWTKFDDPLQFHLEKGESAWRLRLVGAPLHLHVEVRLPALRVASYDLLPLKFSHEVQIPADSIKPFTLPPPTPQTVKVGSTQLSLGLQNLALGTHDGILWVGADLRVGLPVVEAPATPPAPAAPVPPASLPAAPPAPAAPPTPAAPAPQPATPAAPTTTAGK